jgi:uncharacterized phage-associated protein
MASVHDVAAYVLEKVPDGMSTWKLQKLVYYSQAWHLVWDGEPLFSEPIQAWADGPVTRVLYEKHRGQFSVATWTWGKSSALTKSQKETIDAVLRTYGKKTPHWLSQLTHMEKPWKDARGNLPPGTRSTRVITHGAMADYYSQL